MARFRNLLQVTVATLLLVAAQASAQSLPSGNYDDYDREKYANILANQNDLVNRAQWDLRQAEDRLNDAQRRERDADQNLRRETDQLRNAQGRELEITRKIEQNTKAQADLNAKIAAGSKDLQLLQQQVDQNAQSQDRLKSMFQGLQDESNRQQAALQGLRQQQQAAQRAAAEAERAVNDQQALITKLNADLAAAADADKPAIQTKLNEALAALPNILSVREQTKSASDAATAAVSAAQPGADAAKQRADAAQTELNQAVANGNSLRQLRDSKQNEVTANQRALSANQSETTQLNQNLVQIRQQIETEKRDVETAERNFRQATGVSRQAQFERDGAQGTLNTRLRDQDNARRYLDWVDANIEAARRSISEQANRDGSMDGDREGRAIGQERGSRDGQADGLREGNARGISDGQAREYATGSAQGDEQSTKDATVKATADAEVAAKKNGEADGKRDGLAASFAQGKKEGLAHGDATGDDTVAYGKGRAKGEADGLAQAVRDAAYREGEGYTDKENSYLNAPLKEVIIGDAAQAAKYKGLQGRASSSGDDRYYNPRPASYPHPRLQRFYSDAYDSSYRDVLEATFASVYRDVYNDVYNTNYRSAYNQAYAVNYEQSRVQGYKDAYARTYKIVYDRVYASEYKTRYAAYYQTLFNANKDDKAQHDAGFAEGNAIASEAKGYREGKDFAYKANLQIEKDKAYKAGVARADNLYMNNPVIKAVDLQLRDKDADGIFRPGEDVILVAKIKNFGLVSKTDLSSELSGANGISLSAAKVGIAALPGQSEITVVGVSQAVLADAKEGSAFSVNGKLVDSKGVVAMAKSFSSQAMYPAVVSIVGFDGILIPGVATAVKVSVQNRSQGAQNLQLDLGVDATRVNADRVQALVALKAGEKTEIKFTLTGKPEAQFEESALKLVTTQSNLTFAVDQGLKMTIIRRHAPTADSKGLIISGNLAVGGGKALYKADKFDTWDLRVDGSVSSVDKLASYANRVVHVMADQGLALDTATATSILSLVKSKNGSLIVWGNQLDQSKVVSQLAEILNAKAGSGTNVNGTVSGSTALSGVSIKVAGTASTVSGTSRKSRTVLSGGLGVSSFVNGTADKTGWTMTLGLDLKSISADAIKSILSAFNRERMSFGDKLEQSAGSPASLMRLTIAEIQNELIQVDLNGSTRWYKDNEKASKLFRALTRMIEKSDSKSAARAEFGKFYPTGVDALNGIRSTDEKWYAEAVFAKGFGSFFTQKRWQDLYCEGKWNNDRYCVNDRN